VFQAQLLEKTMLSVHLLRLVLAMDVSTVTRTVSLVRAVLLLAELLEVLHRRVAVLVPRMSISTIKGPGRGFELLRRGCVRNSLNDTPFCKKMFQNELSDV
jgi:hypothetical protein